VTVRVFVGGDLNFVMFEREVFGVDPSKLQECKPPGPDEVTGSLLHGEQAEQFIDTTLRPALLGPEEAERVRRQLEKLAELEARCDLDH